MSEEKKLKLENPEIFINRVAEKKYFLDYLNNVPRNILFVYWPKSTWKTTLIYKIINEELDNTKYDVNFINLRMVLMNNFQDFKNLFFPLDLMWKSKKKLNWLKLDWKVNIPLLWEFWYEWKSEDENMMKTNLFWLMEKKLRELNRDWIKPVIILDEFQYLKEIIIDEKNNLTLVEELFKFFIWITKQYNLAHVVCLTSDSYYMEELYWDTKLAKTSDFYLMEHLSKKDIFYWLEDLEKIDKKIVNKIWENLGWSVWEVWQVLVSYKNTWSYKEKLDDLLDVNYSLIADYYSEKLEEDYRKDFIEVLENIVKEWEYIMPLNKKLFSLIKNLVDKDLWFYDTKKRKVTANSKSLEIAFKRLLKELK